VLCLLLGACSAPCEKSADVLLTLSGDSALLSAATRLSLVLTVNGTPVAQQPAPINGPFAPGTTVLLVPSSAPAESAYTLGVSATLSRDLAIVASASTSFPAASHACNRGTITFSASAPADGSMLDFAQRVDDLAHHDLAKNEDLAHPDLACGASAFDEDGDTIPDSCDVCAANADNPPTDNDGDGVPNACDPAPANPVNQVVLFEPFNAPLSGWTGAMTESSGSLVVGSSGCTNYAQRTTGVGGQVQIQTYVTPTAFNLASAPDFSSVGLYALDNGNMSTGVACLLQIDSMGGTNLIVAQGAVLGDPNFGGGGTRTPQTLPSTDVAVGTTVRLRMTLRNSYFTCDVASATGQLVASKRVTAAMSYANLQPILGTCFAGATYSSLFAVSE